ncbi:MAG TPA: osmotically inducible protein C [Gammaproteobacteria bacterium]|nr:osmotically inducible protein C [Gammaproteobacteria bacterium]
MKDQQPHESTAEPRVNGVNLEILKGTVQAIADDPDLGKCRFRATNAWHGGTDNRTTVSGFYGAKQEIPHKQQYVMRADEPPILAGGDEGANPVEYLLGALASCVTTSMVAHAAVRGIHIDSLESELEGDIDLNGFLGLSDSTPKGYTDIRIRFRVKTDADNMEQLQELSSFSPVLNTLTHGTNVSIELDRM